MPAASTSRAVLPERTTPAYCWEWVTITDWAANEPIEWAKRNNGGGPPPRWPRAAPPVGQAPEPGGTEVPGRPRDRGAVPAVVAGADGVPGVVEGTCEPVIAGGVLGEAVGDL